MVLKDITDAKEMYVYEALVDKTFAKMFNIPDEDIKKVDSKIPPNLCLVKGTMDIHQLLFSVDMFNHRVVSCFCKVNCTCYGLEKPMPGITLQHMLRYGNNEKWYNYFIFLKLRVLENLHYWIFAHMHVYKLKLFLWRVTQSQPFCH